MIFFKTTIFKTYDFEEEFLSYTFENFKRNEIKHNFEHWTNCDSEIKI